jgi:hypothetical protein
MSDDPVYDDPDYPSQAGRCGEPESKPVRKLGRLCPLAALRREAVRRASALSIP